MRISPIPIVLKGNPLSIAAMARPQSSLVGLGSGMLAGYSAIKLRNMGGQFDRVMVAQAAGTAITLSAIETVADLQIASMHMIQQCDTKLQTLSEISWEIASYFDQKAQHEEFIAAMRFSVHTANRALDQIDVLTEEHPEYALYQTDRLVEMIEKRDVRVEHFSYDTGFDSMTMAQKMLDRVENTRGGLVSILEDMTGVKEYRLLTRTMKTITTRSNKLEKAKNRLAKKKEGKIFQPALKKLRAQAADLRAKRKKEEVPMKTELEQVKLNEAQVEKKLEQIPKRYEWGDAESLKQEMEQIKEKFRTTSFFSFARRGELRARLKVLEKREKLWNEDGWKRTMFEQQLKTIGNQRHNLEFEIKNNRKKRISFLESQIEDLVKSRNSEKKSTKKEIKLLEKEIQQLWDSISHLIPFSTALEKA